MKGIEHYSRTSTANGFAAGMVAIAVFQGYRFLKTQTWGPDWLKEKELDNLGLIPLPSGGAMLSYAYEF